MKKTLVTVLASSLVLFGASAMAEEGVIGGGAGEGSAFKTADSVGNHIEAAKKACAASVEHATAGHAPETAASLRECKKELDDVTGDAMGMQIEQAQSRINSGINAADAGNMADAKTNATEANTIVQSLTGSGQVNYQDPGRGLLPGN